MAGCKKGQLLEYARYTKPVTSNQSHSDGQFCVQWCVRHYRCNWSIIAQSVLLPQERRAWLAFESVLPLWQVYLIRWRTASLRFMLQRPRYSWPGFAILSHFYKQTSSKGEKKKIHHLPKERWLCKVGGGDGKGGGWVHQRREVYVSKVENEKQIFFSIFVCPEFWCVDLPLAHTKDLDSHVNNPLNNAAIVWILAR